MKVALFSDLHAHPHQEHARLLSHGVLDRLQDCVSVIPEIVSVCQERGIEDILFGGDLFHKRGIVHTQTYNLIAEELAFLQHNGRRFYCVPGNHDQIDKAGAHDALEALSWAGLVERGNLDGAWWSLGDGALMVAAFSYCDSAEDFQRRLEEFHEARERNRLGKSRWIALFHHGFKGARIGSTLEYEVKEHIDGATLNSLGFDAVFSGHYHAHQPIVNVRNGYYIGSPLEHTRSDRLYIEDPQKGFLIYDSETCSLERVPLRRPRFLAIVPEEINDVDVEGHFVDVTVALSHAKELEAALYERGARGVRVILPALAPALAKERLSLPELTSDVEILKRYMLRKKKEIRASGLDPKKLYLRGKQLITAAEDQ